MAYLLPSYFQKRLLRYALARLDFIETEDLDLDNLGITLGQRSVIELKNVAIKVQRLVTALSLPTNITVSHASIRSLRLTIPADLHTSGIVVEVDGVDVEVYVAEEDTSSKSDHKKRQSHSAPRRGDGANRPRISSSAIHDPGGARYGSRFPAQAIPSSKDLAMSFLETEPLEERQELEAVVEAQSQHFSDPASSITSAGGESDLGLAGGLSLPGFVANFFKGVANRLAVEVKNVSVVIELSRIVENVDNVKFLVRLSEIGLPGLHASESSSEDTDVRRSIRLDGLELSILSDTDFSAPVSARNSPQLARSDHRTSPTSPQDIDSDASPGNDLDARASPVFATGLGVDDGDVFMRGSQHLDDSLASELMLSNIQARHGRHQTQSTVVDNRLHAEKSMQSQYANADNRSTNVLGRKGSEDLAASMLYTHDDAKSMYMSAIGGDPGQDSTLNAMPGAWGWSDAVVQQPPVASTAPGVRRAGPFVADESDPTSVREQSTHPSSLEAQPHGNAGTSAATNGLLAPDVILKTLVRIDHITVRLPEPSPGEDLQAPREHASGGRQRYGATQAAVPLRSRGGSAPTSVSDIDAGTSIMQPLETLRLQATISDLKPEKQATFEAEIGSVSLDIDMAVMRTIVKFSQAIMSTTGRANDQKSPKAERATLPLSFVVNRLQISIIEHVSTVSYAVLQATTRSPTITGELSLLQLTLLQTRFDMLAAGTVHQRLSISKITLSHLESQIMSFVDTINVKDSIATSAMLRPNDVVIKVVDGRSEVQIKPVHIMLDLLVLDDVLTRSGGLSSLLDLGNSIVSTNTVKSMPSEANRSRPRSVRFDASASRTKSDSDSSLPSSKINVRLSGAVVDLVGSESTIQIKMAAIKLVYRQEAIRVVIDGAAVDGPIPLGAKTAADTYAKIKEVDILYRTSPEEPDLDRLLSLLAPSNDKYDQDDDEIMVDTLLRQRRKGGVLRLKIAEIQLGIDGLQWQSRLSKMSDELSKLSSVTKYLPEDDRPGILTFALINKLKIRVALSKTVSSFTLTADLLEGAHISVPSLMAAQVSNLGLSMDEGDAILGEVNTQAQTVMGSPMIMCRFIADEMEPTVRLKVSNLCFEYKVPTLLAITRFLDYASSYTTSGGTEVPSMLSSPASSSSNDSSKISRKVKLFVVLRDSAIALYPSDSPAKGLLLLSDANLLYGSHRKKLELKADIKKATMLIIDNVTSIGHELSNADHRLYFDQNDQVQELTKAGFVPVGSISSASITVVAVPDETTQDQLFDVEIRNNLFLLETCADSTQTLFQILSGLSPPAPPSKAQKYRTEVVPIQDMLASFTGNAFVSEPGPELGMQASHMTNNTTESNQYSEYGDDEDDYESDRGLINDLYAGGTDTDDEDDQMAESYVETEMSHSTATASVHIAPVDIAATTPVPVEQSILVNSLLDFRSDHFQQKSSVGGTAHRWDSTKNTYGFGSENTFKDAPLKVRVRDVHFIWNLFDGYDWQSTRDTISQAVRDIENKAMARRPRGSNRLSPGAEVDEESVIGDFLFNSIYIGIPANKDPRELANAINHDIDDLVSETGSYATGTTVATAQVRGHSGIPQKAKKLRLNRSKQHKMTFELEGVSADIVSFPPNSGEVESSLDVRVKKLDVFDHVPTSTWKKFATYMHEAGEREVDTSQVHIELLNVKPVADLAASEIVLQLTVLPLRLHVDQDALDFLTRFFEFKDDSVPAPTTASAPAFIQRAEVNPVRLRLDFKPKRIDYGGLRSGRTTEFMNFFVLDRADMVLRRVILYGVSGFDRLGIMLNNIWSPDVRRNQLPTVLAGLAPIRSIVDVGSGVRDLVAIPIREYKKDGRIVRSIQKGAIAFAKTTTTELVSLGAKLAIGTQQVLQNAEGMLVRQAEDSDSDEEMRKQISLYADQPVGIVQGLRGAYASLERDLLLAKDAIVAVPGEVMASGSATGAAKAVLKQSPTIILRPAIGATKAIGQTLLGAGNTLDKRNLRRIEDVSPPSRTLISRILTILTEVQETLAWRSIPWSDIVGFLDSSMQEEENRRLDLILSTVCSILTLRSHEYIMGMARRSLSFQATNFQSSPLSLGGGMPCYGYSTSPCRRLFHPNYI